MKLLKSSMEIHERSLKIITLRLLKCQAPAAYGAGWWHSTDAETRGCLAHREDVEQAPKQFSSRFQSFLAEF